MRKVLSYLLVIASVGSLVGLCLVCVIWPMTRGHLSTVPGFHWSPESFYFDLQDMSPAFVDFQWFNSDPRFVDTGWHFEVFGEDPHFTLTKSRIGPPEPWEVRPAAQWTMLVGHGCLVLCRFEFRGSLPGSLTPYWSMHLFPLWGLAALFLPGSAVLGVRVFQRVRSRLRRMRNQCLRCSYDLTGNVSGICPECGTPVEEGRAG